MASIAAPVLAVVALVSAPPAALAQSLLSGAAPPVPIAPTAGPTVGPGDVGSQSVDAGTLTVLGGPTVVGSFTAFGTGTGVLDTTGGSISVTQGIAVEAGATITSIGPGPLNVSSPVGDVAVSFGGLLSLQNVTVTETSAAGESFVGVGAVGGGSVQITNGTIIANNGVGVTAFDGGTVTLTNVAVSASGSEVGAVPPAGILVGGGGTVIGDGVTVTTTDPGNSALLMMPFSLAPGDSASFTNSTLSSANAPAVAVLGGTHDLTLNGSSVIGGTQWLDVKSGTEFDTGTPVPGSIIVTASASMLTGAASTEAGSTSNVTLQNGTLWTMTGSSTLTNLSNLNSTINFTPPTGDPTQLSSYKTLTVTNYTAVNATLGLNTFLAADGSPSDRLVVNGTAAGNTALRITNAGGLGDLTTGNGILNVIDLGPQARVLATFTLANPVVAGPYEYMLFRGTADGSNPNAWFLRSTYDCALAGTPAILCTTPPPEGAPPPEEGLPPGSTPGVQVPHYRQEVSLYAAIPALTLQYGRALINTLHERVGGDVNLPGAGGPPATALAGGFATAYGDGSGAGPRVAPDPYTDAAPPTYANGAWGRVFAQHGNQDGDRLGIYGSGPRYDYDLTAIQAGFDVLRWQDAGGLRTHAGVYGAFGDLNSDVTHFDSTFAGRDSFAAYTVGGYWTWIGRPGWYLDGVAQGTWYDVRGQSTRLPALETDGWGFASSLEGGYPLHLWGRWAAEPQAQVVYQTVDLGSTSDIAAKVRFDDVDSLAGRLGVRFVTTWLAPGLTGPTPATVWVRPSMWEEFLGEPRTLFSSETGFIPFRADLGNVWGEINAGIAAQVGRSTALYASGSYEVGFDGRTDAWDGKVGLRVQW